MASHLHFMIDALHYLDDPDRDAHSAADERASIAVRTGLDSRPPAERQRRARRRARFLGSVVTLARQARAGRAPDGPTNTNQPRSAA